MVNILEAEGWGYLDDHFKESGFIPHDNLIGVFAFHSKSEWKEIRELALKQWGRFQFFNDARLLKQTSMRDGRINHVFRLI